jgi:hypothetical protein
MAKETTKKFRLPAQGKPKPKVKKTSAKELGKTANEQFKAGTRDKDKATIPLYNNNGIKNTAKQEASITAETRRRGVSDSDSEKFMKERKNKVESRKRKIARITGV